MFYIFVNRVSEREKGPELINQEGIQFGFYGHGYWSYFVGIFLFFINAVIWELESWLAAGPRGSSGLHETPDSNWDLGLGVGDRWGRRQHGQAAVKIFRKHVTLQASGV